MVQDLRFAIRQLRRQPASIGLQRFYLVVLVTFAVFAAALAAVAVAAATGLAIALAASQALNAVVFNISTRDPLTYAVVAITLLLAVTLATLIPAVRAARVDPLVAIRP